jgi:hypothetical protein
MKLSRPELYSRHGAERRPFTHCGEDRESQGISSPLYSVANRLAVIIFAEGALSWTASGCGKLRSPCW